LTQTDVEFWFLDFRFTKNTFYVEKNPTIVNFPIRGIEFGDLLRPEMKVRNRVLIDSKICFFLNCCIIPGLKHSTYIHVASILRRIFEKKGAKASISQ
jgi:hypothetical protein